MSKNLSAKYYQENKRKTTKKACERYQNLSKKFYDIENEEYKFNQYKRPISISDINVNELVVSNKFPFGKQDFKYFIGYKDNKEIRLLHNLSRNE